MYKTIKIADRRNAFTLMEMLVAITIIVVLAALAAAFAPRIDDNQKLSRAVDNLEQWLLTAKMRARRDGLATGLRFVQAPGDANSTYGPSYSQFQYIQQPDPLSGGILLPSTTNPLPSGTWIPAPSPPFPSGLLLNGGYIASAAGGTVTFENVDFSLGGIPSNQWLVQPGDYLGINGGGVYYIAAVTSSTTLQLGSTSYDLALNIPTTSPTTNYRIIRQPRILIGEEPLALPNNYAANFGPLPGITPATSGCNVANGPSGFPEILFSPMGAVIGSNAGNPTIVISVWDTTMEVPDPNRVGVVGIQSRSGFIGAYGVSLSGNPFLFVQTARESGL